MIFAVIRTQYEFIHSWGEAPEAVQFLQYPHRHMFHVTVWVEQFHDNRDIEYILLKRWLDWHIDSAKESWPQHSSCEMMAQAIREAVVLYARPNKRTIRVEVSEDGENGALVTD